MFDISKIRPKSTLDPVKAQNFSRYLGEYLSMIRTHIEAVSISSEMCTSFIVLP